MSSTRRPRVAGRPATRPSAPRRPSTSDDESRRAMPTDGGPARAPAPSEKSAEAEPETAPPAQTTDGVATVVARPAGAPSADTSTDASSRDRTAVDDAVGVATADAQAPTDATVRRAYGSPRGKARPPVRVSTIKPQASRPTSGRGMGNGGREATPRRVRRFIGWRTVGVVAAIAVVIGAFAGVAAARPGVDLSDNEAFVDSAVTSQVTAQAKARICSVFGVNYAKLDDWERTAKANVTGEAANRFTQYSGAVRDALGQTGLTEGSVDCRVDAVGVRSITGDTATLVTNLVLSQTQGQQAAGSGTKRYQVAMQRVDGQWLIANFTDF